MMSRLLVRSVVRGLPESRWECADCGARVPPNILGPSFNSNPIKVLPMPMTLADLSKKMQDIDYSMLFTRAADGAMAGRPMSNNGDVEYDGDSFFFTDESSKMVHDIERDPVVALSLAGAKGFLGKPGFFIAVEGKADLIREKAAFAAHWTKDLDRWFEAGMDTPGLVLIKVHADRVHYWDGEDSGEVAV
jgi:general stress protein 26